MKSLKTENLICYGRTIKSELGKAHSKLSVIGSIKSYAGLEENEWRNYYSSRAVISKKFGNMEIQILLLTEMGTIEKAKLFETLYESQGE